MWLRCCGYRYGQRDPLTEYKLEGYELFKEMLARVRRNVIYNVYVFTPTRLTPQDGGGEAANGGDKGAAKGEKFAARKKAGARKKVPASAES